MAERPPKDRDKLTRKTPPEGIASQLAPPPRGAFDDDPPTRPGLDPIGRIDDRTRRIARESSAIPGTISAVRTELKSDIAEVKADVGSLKEDFKETAAHVGDLRATVGAISGKLDILPSVVELATMRRQEEHVVVTARVDVEKHAELAKIDETSAQKKAYLERGTKWLAIISTVIAGVMALLETRHC